MSGRPKMSLKKYTSIKYTYANTVFCIECGLGPGWGWNVPNEYRWYFWGERNSLPLASNGFPKIGICKGCFGSGITPIPFSEIL